MLSGSLAKTLRMLLLRLRLKAESNDLVRSLIKDVACATAGSMGCPSEAMLTPTATAMYVSLMEVANPI